MNLDTDVLIRVLAVGLWFGNEGEEEGKLNYCPFGFSSLRTKFQYFVFIDERLSIFLQE